MNRFLLTMGLTLAMALAARAQNFSIDWFSIDGGGGTSTGGVYSLSGTIGQPDAGVLSGGVYTVVGGFWGAVIPVQQVGAPTLFIDNLLNGSVRISWAPPTPGFVLQEAPALSAPTVPWTNAPSGAANPVVLPASMQTRFFRLIRP